MTVRRASDTQASNFKGVRSKSREYAVTDDDGDATHASLRRKRVRQEKGGEPAQGRPSTSALFLRDWLIAYPSKSGCYSQPETRSSTGGSTSHEHVTGGQ